MTQTAAGTIIVVAALTSIINGSSPVGMWAIINQFQMLLLLLLTGAYMPKAVRQYLSGMNVMFFNFNFIPFNKIPFIYDLYLWLEFEHNDEELKEIGIENGSTIVNNISTIAILISFAIIHMVIALIYIWKRSKTRVCSQATTIAWKVMNFTAYIRLILMNIIC